jgi:nicotinamidase-related amidase
MANITTKTKVPLLVIIDYQNDFVDQKGKVAEKLKVDLSENRKILGTLKNLLDKWHQRNYPVLYVNSDYSTRNYVGEYKKYREEKSAFGNTAMAGTWGHQLYGLTKEEGDEEIVKNYLDGFWKTNLENYLKVLDPSEIYFCGLYTDVCVFHTSLHASLLGYKIFVVKDGVATPNKENGQIFLNYLGNFCGIVSISENEIRV